jgi:hypothetical protein
MGSVLLGEVRIVLVVAMPFLRVLVASGLDTCLIDQEIAQTSDACPGEKGHISNRRKLTDVNQ